MPVTRWPAWRRAVCRKCWLKMTAGQELPLSPQDIERFGHDPEANIRSNLEALQKRIFKACDKAGRDHASVRLLPVTKTVPAHIMRLAVRAGVTSFGENKIQEATGKQKELADLAVNWSIIGHLQTNKVKYLLRFASEFHALDSERLADQLNRRLEREGRFLDVYVQVNTSGEESKYGLAPNELLPFIGKLKDYPHLRPRGLMTLALFSDDMDRVRPCFRLLRHLRDEARQIDADIAGLSMGMSGDYEAAIEEGATVVRVGQAIFGNRPTPDSHYWPVGG